MNTRTALLLGIGQGVGLVLLMATCAELRRLETPAAVGVVGEQR